MIGKGFLKIMSIFKLKNSRYELHNKALKVRNIIASSNEDLYLRHSIMCLILIFPGHLHSLLVYSLPPKNAFMGGFKGGAIELHNSKPLWSRREIEVAFKRELGAHNETTKKFGLDHLEAAEAASKMSLKSEVFGIFLSDMRFK